MDNELEKQKSIEFYSESVSAWYLTKIEKDKSLLTMSVAAIGLLITLITSLDNPTAWVAVIAIFSFIVCSGSIILIFEQNANYIQSIILNKNKKYQKLKYLDTIANWSFMLGIIISLVFSFSTYHNNKNQKKELPMSHKHRIMGANCSFHGLNELKPKYKDNKKEIDHSLNRDYDKKNIQELNKEKSSSKDVRPHYKLVIKEKINSKNIEEYERKRLTPKNKKSLFVLRKFKT